MTHLLAVAHGSKAPEPQQVVEDLLALVRAQGVEAGAAYVDNASPSVARALDDLVGQGVSDVVVLPLLLTPASHSKTDVAASVQAGRLEHPGLRLRYGRPLGPHPVLVDLLARRLAEAGAADGDPVLLVAVGALDPDANAQVFATGRLLHEGRPWPSVDVAFASTAGPSVPQALDRLARLGHQRVSLVPYALGPGRLPAMVARQADEAPLDVVVAAPLGADPALAGVVRERFAEALGEDVRMNCDACLYRTPLPGHESSVGAPQTAHTHPDDDLVAQVTLLEKQLLTAEIRGSKERLEQLLDPEFTEIGASGRRWTRSAMIAALLADPEATEGTEFAGTVLGPELVLLSYRTPAQRTSAHRTSLWRRTDGAWRLVHHQGTPV